MEREILFRGKRKDNGKWIEGYLFRCWERAYIAWGMVNDNADMKEVGPKTICQYTGLTDKNGRKIFEGDILKSELGKVGKIAFNESHMAFMILEKTENRYYHVEECSGKHMEVIGNIFDNPELLRGA